MARGGLNPLKGFTIAITLNLVLNTFCLIN